MKIIKMFEEFSEYIKNQYDFDKYPLNEDLLILFDKYKSTQKEQYIHESDVVKSLKLIKGDGEFIYDGMTSPRYREYFGNYALIVFGYDGVGWNKSVYSYEIKVVDVSTKTTRQVGGGYGTSGIDFAFYQTLAYIGHQACPSIYDVDVISNIINDFREIIIKKLK